jgi:dGTPase
MAQIAVSQPAVQAGCSSGERPQPFPAGYRPYHFFGCISPTSLQDASTPVIAKRSRAYAFNSQHRSCVCGPVSGHGIGAEITKPPTITQDTLGYVVQAACLAHDIGNPPFGHFGEHAIQSWFKKNTEPGSRLAVRLEDTGHEDFTLFDGNAQGFRVITQLEDAKWTGGLQLTHAVLGTFTKYPHASNIITDDYIGGKKPGFFRSEERYFTDVACHLGLKQRDFPTPYWCRHPLAFLVEAADDICYKIIDIEDGYELGYLSFGEAKDILAPIAFHDPNLTTLPAQDSDQIGKLRAAAVGTSVKECIRVFLENEDKILAGDFRYPLIDLTKLKDEMKHASEIARKRIFESENITKLKITGATVVEGLLDVFSEVVIGLEGVDFDLVKLKGKAARLARLMGRNSLIRANNNNTHDALLCLTDFVSGMTDRFAVDTYRTLKGIST